MFLLRWLWTWFLMLARRRQPRVVFVAPDVDADFIPPSRPVRGLNEAIEVN